MLSKKDLKLLSKIKATDYIFKLESGKTPKLANEEECLLIKEVVEKIIKIAPLYTEGKIKVLEDVNFEKMESFSFTNNKISHKKIKFPQNYYSLPDIDKLNKDELNKLLLFNNKDEYNVGLFYAPMNVKGSYPFLLIIQNEMNQNLVSVEVFENISSFGNVLLNVLVKNKIVPKTINFNCDEALILANEVIKELKIKVNVNPQMYSLFNIWEEIYNSLDWLLYKI